MPRRRGRWRHPTMRCAPRPPGQSFRSVQARSRRGRCSTRGRRPRALGRWRPRRWPRLGGERVPPEAGAQAARRRIEADPGVGPSDRRRPRRQGGGVEPPEMPVNAAKASAAVFMTAAGPISTAGCEPKPFLDDGCFRTPVTRLLTVLVFADMGVSRVLTRCAILEGWCTPSPLLGEARGEEYAPRSRAWIVADGAVARRSSGPHEGKPDVSYCLRSRVRTGVPTSEMARGTARIRKIATTALRSLAERGSFGLSTHEGGDRRRGSTRRADRAGCVGVGCGLAG